MCSLIQDLTITAADGCLPKILHVIYTRLQSYTRNQNKLTLYSLAVFK